MEDRVAAVWCYTLLNGGWFVVSYACLAQCQNIEFVIIDDIVNRADFICSRTNVETSDVDGFRRGCALARAVGDSSKMVVSC